MRDKPNPEAEKLVLAKEPNAFVYDDGERVYIHVAKDRNCECSRCGHNHVISKAKFIDTPAIGAGGSSSWAWHSAALHFNLITE